MTPDSAGNDHLPVYESLLRERGDVVAEARVAAEHMQHQAPQGPSSHDWGPSEPGPQ
ncbi:MULTISPECIES: hypothetical protein [unclassified Streptomyces]|uniref:hypothetical protein n=1 Tax=unclassified Streptomyces TaxID=2593676 RepID=UPI00224C8BBD|nr:MULTISPECIES: hypothetical protein [unclassified Streptomyces]MCX4878959.1 hypothetical protein [Streptomyces sp. NBC_00847]MCX5418914.1 hypothetical protein [Streptomyces sp. NBC_00078]